MAARSIERLRAALRRAVAASGDAGETAFDQTSPPRFVALSKGHRFNALKASLAPCDLLCAMSEKAVIDLSLGGMVEAVIVDYEPGRDVSLLLERLRALPGLSDLPILAIAPPFETTALIEAGADIVVDDGAVRLTAERMALHYREIGAIRDRLRRSKAAMPGESVNEPHILQHIGLALAEVEPHFALALIAAFPLDRDGEASSDPTLSLSLYQILSTLTRAEDLVFLTPSGQLALLLPEIGLAEAQAVIERLARVCRQSAFVDTENRVVSGISLKSAVVTGECFASAASLWENLCTKLNA